MNEKLNMTIAKIPLKNPLIGASGAFGYGLEFENFSQLSNLGALATKGTSIKEKIGNPSPRIAETPMGMLNSIGLENPGIDYFISHSLPWLLTKNVRIIVNICGNDLCEYVALAEKLNETKIDMIEVNISCPNVKKGGFNFGTSKDLTFELISAIRKKTSKPLIVKLSPNVTSIVEIAKAAELAGADAISLINTVLGMRINIKSKRPVVKNNVGGLSGPAILPIAIRMVWQTFKAVSIPIIGGGGISSYEDAIEMIIAGACAFFVGTAFFTDPLSPIKIIDGLENWLTENKIKNIKELVGSVKEWR